MIDALIFGLVGGAILLITSRFGILLSTKMNERGISVVLLMIMIQFVFVGAYTFVCVMMLGLPKASYALGIGVGIFTDIIYKCYLALKTDVPAKPRPHWVFK